MSGILQEIKTLLITRYFEEIVKGKRAKFSSGLYICADFFKKNSKQKINIMVRLTFYFLAISFMLVSCYPDGAEYYEDTDIVYTNYKDDFDFSSKGSFAMPDQVVKITGELAEGQDPEFIQEPYNSQILSQIETNMTKLGWQRVEDPAQADLTLFPASASNTTVFYYYDYWCWYYPYYCGWGYYPGAGYYSSYTTGSLVMSMVVDGDEYIDPLVVWTGILNGMASGSFNTSRVTGGIDQAFEQSPYLMAN